MKRTDIIYNINSFINSKEFKDKCVERVGNEFKDVDYDIVYSIIVDNINDLDNLPTIDNNPYVILAEGSKKKEVLDKIGKEFDYDLWDDNKVNHLTGNELDYVYQIQHNRLNKPITVKLFKSRFKE